ncbi:GIY-YIG nuclease family protein [uncultured Roseivirga sp.]|uniref:GIY-YIG nuclease family protein n=1 Tax=uncultured Roseivirga sp. TaxID=543088 RepID=UPI00267EB9BC
MTVTGAVSVSVIPSQAGTPCGLRKAKKTIKMKPKGGYVYIMSNKNRTVLYIGVTSDLQTRVLQHEAGTFGGFTKSITVRIYSTMNFSII